MFSNVLSLGMGGFWIALLVLMLIVEGLAPGLVSIWFACGALVAFISSLFNAPVWFQIFWFVVVSVAALIFTRPLVKKFVNSRTEATNADRAIGKDCVVTEDIDNLSGTGAARFESKEWTARAESEGLIIPKGTVAEILRIEGVKLIVKPKC